MAKPVSHYVAEALTLSWLTGPVFDKELKVSSRRRRNYVLRFVYLAVMTLFMALVWIEEVGRFDHDGEVVMRQSRMAIAGVMVVALAIWFQFIASQLVTIIMCSTSISDEIYSKTLGVMMTTPIRSVQIVLGKIFSKLLQVVGLLLISLPLLAMVRVMGGVPWDFLWTSLLITLSTILFIGSISMFFSIFNRHAYLVIIETIIAMGVVFLLAPLVFWVIAHDGFDWREIDVAEIICWFNPYLVLAILTDTLDGGRVPFMISWWPPCLAMLAGSAIILFLSSVVVRKVALRQATGRSVSFFKGRKKPSVAAVGVTSVGDLAAEAAVESASPLRRVGDMPVLWKELRTPLIRSWKWRLAARIVILALLAIVYIICVAEHAFRDRETQIAFGIVLAGFAALCTAIFSATTITAEKEARSWDILLLTGQSDWQILLGKFGGVLRRSAPFWLLLNGHVAVFVLLGGIRPAGLLDSVMVSLQVLMLLAAGGVFFSTYFRKTTTAVILNITLALVIWAVIPGVAAFFEVISERAYGYERSQSVFFKVVTGNPFLQIGVSMESNGHRWFGDYSPYYGHSYYDSHGHYRWPDKDRSWAESFGILWIWVMIYFGASWGLLRLAKACMRKRL